MQWVHKRLGEGVFANVVSLYGAYVVNYAVPLFTIPYLVRVLGPASWGLVAMAQGLGNYLNLIVEYGFNLSATREIARHRESPDQVADLVTGVVAAKFLLAAAALIVAFVLQQVVPALRSQPRIFWAGVAAGIALGLNPLWYFQGCERMKVVATLEIIAKTAAAAGVFLLIHGPADAWRVAGLQAAASILCTGAGTLIMIREVAPRRATASLVRQALSTGWTMFIFRSSAMLYTSGNSFLLGLFAPPAAVGYFAGAEKISKAFMGLLNPINQALYPRLSRLAKHDRGAGSRLLKVNALLVGGGGVILGVMVYVSAPLLIRFLLGPALLPAVPVLRLLAILPPLIGLNTVLGTQWMAPFGMDRILNRIILAAGLLNVALAVLLAPRYQQMGMALAVVGAELFIGLTSGYLVVSRGTQGEPVAAPAFTVSDLENPA